MFASGPQSPAPSAARIAFAGIESDGTSRIYVMDADGKNGRPITSGPHDTAPSWSPDGQQVAFSRLVGPTDARLFVVKPNDPSGSSPQQLTVGPVDTDPAWSPDGSRIAFLRTGLPQVPLDQADPANRVYVDVINADGSNLVVTGARAWGSGTKLTWSPDSRRIAFARKPTNTPTQNGANQLFTIMADGSGQAPIPTPDCQPWGASWPDWSPDGSKIAFFCDTHGGGQAWIALVSPSGGAVAKIGDGRAIGNWPTWSPDGSKIAVGPGRGGIIVMSADGTGQVNIGAGGAAVATEPDWQPSGRCTGLKGLVVDGAASDGHQNPLRGVRVQLLRAGQVVATDATDELGKYCISAGGAAPGDYRLRATLVDAAHDPPLFETRYATETEATFVEVPVTASDFGGPDKDVEFTNAAADTSSANRNLADVANIHYQSERFVRWVVDKLGITPAALGRFTIVTFDASDDSTRYIASRHTVYILAKDSPFSERDTALSEGPENQEWHEIDHHVADALGIAPFTSAPCGARVDNHGGWRNPNTCDSLAEGFAMFLPVLASLDIDAGRGPGYGTTDYAGLLNVEDNGYFPWSHVGGYWREDMAVTQLLWDLADDTPAESQLVSVRDAAGLTGPVWLDDAVALGGTKLVHLLSTGHVLTVADIYDLLLTSDAVPLAAKARTVDLTGDATPDATPLDAVFLLHGFRPVGDLQAPGTYRLGDPVGHTQPGQAGLTDRRGEPGLPGSAIRLLNPSAAPTTVTLDLAYPATASHFEVVVPAAAEEIVRLELPPYWQAILAEDDPLPACGKPGQRTVQLTVSAPGMTARTIDNCEYLHAVQAATGGIALTIDVAAAGPTAGEGPGGAVLAGALVAVVAVVILGLALLLRGRRRATPAPGP